MTKTLLTGPSVIAGSLLGNGSIGVPEYNPDGGPSISYMGDSFPDVRVPILKDYVDRGGVIPSHANNQFTCLLNCTPAAASTTAIAAAAATTSGTAMTLATTVGATPGVGTAVPFYPNGSSTLTTGVMIEPGFTTGTTTASSATVASVPKAGLAQMFVGQWIVIPNVGNSGGTSALITRVTAITYTSGTTGSFTVADAPAASLTAARVCQANLFSNLWGGTATAVVPYINCQGPAAIYDPAAMCTRVVSITATNGGATGGAFTVRGYDEYGVAMSELITHAGAATTKYGRKGFKVVTSVTPGFTDAQSYSVGFGDEVGLGLRSDLWEFLTVFYAGAAITSSTGYTAADTTTPATTSTTSTRGSLAIGIVNNAGAGISGGAFNSSRRLTVYWTASAGYTVNATPFNPVPLYGVTQV